MLVAPRVFLPRLVLFSLLSSYCALAIGDDTQPTPEQLEFAEKQVRPILTKHCFQCHSAEAEKLKAGLHLDNRQAMLRGGDSGPAITPGQPQKSLLLQAVNYEEYEMPPDGKLPAEQIAVLTKWIEQGAPWPAEKPRAVASATEYSWDELRGQHWAWQPISQPSPPEVRHGDWPRNHIDRFVLARLEAAGLEPAAPAGAKIVVRRIYFDLIGLPPTPEQVQAFETESASNARAAIAKLVDRLLESPHYGERWGRYWLDVARYSDGFGGFLDSADLPHAWRYRDWVVAAFNQDLPYDRFVKLQIAGDQIDPASHTVATGFFALGPTYKSDGGDPEATAQARSETLDDRVDTLSRGLMAVTVSCARCHDHKFDPIPTLDYYSLAGVFNNTNVREAQTGDPEAAKRFNEHQQRVKQLQQNIKKLDEQAKKEKRELGNDEKKRRAESQSSLDGLNKNAPAQPGKAHALHDTGKGDMKVALRGNLRKPGPVAPRRFLRILAGKDPQPFGNGSGRVELADTVASADNPLTARVIVNRIWMHHFGRAIVRTPSNFGTLGRKPTHPALLDWLASQLIESGWSIKQLHRTIMLSAAYQMSSQFDAAAFGKDGDNELIWRMNPRRLDVEAWRDSVLAATGELDRALGGPASDNILASRRRTLYTRVSRNGDRFQSDLFLRLFDFPMPRATIPKRTTSVVPQQFLFMMNSQFMVDRAKALSARLAGEADNDDERIQRAYRLLFGRPPTDEERQIATEYLTATPDAADKPPLSRWQQYAQVLLSSNEFMYIQ